jgi:NAD(P)-dependent dehydrogenase (short-subunit alcohol dehydrogenase family)
MYQAFDLQGKVALVTGGNSGIGIGMAEGLAQAGADVMIWGTNPAKNERALEALRAHGTRVEARLVDVANEAEVVAAMADTIATLGRLDACFANAGLSLPVRSFLDLEGDAYRRVMAVNLDGAVWTMREACRHMVARAKDGDPGGSIVATSSMNYNFGAAGNQHYTATKMAVVGVTNGIAVEFARHGIRANALLAGWTASDLTGVLQDNDKFNANVISRVPQRRWGQPDDFGGIAVYLASEASKFHTGDAILIDGGYSRF